MIMTKEELSKAMSETKKEIVIKNLHKLLLLVKGYPEYEDCIDYVIDELEESCNDCISRQAVLDIAKTSKSNWIDNSILFKKVNNLPSATPIRPKGYWMKEESIYGWDGKSYQCSSCGRSIHLDKEVESLEDYPYCHCGAKMIEL